jgi:hypothetical protein
VPSLSAMPAQMNRPSLGTRGVGPSGEIMRLMGLANISI